MKLIVSIIILSLGLRGTGQPITLDNTWTAGSQLLFIGVENKLILGGNVSTLRSFRSEKSTLERHGDTLVVKPAQPGPLEIIIETTTGQKITHKFTVGYLPAFGLIITDDPTDTKDVSKDKILKSKKMFLVSRRSDIKLYEDYMITETVLNISDKVYQSLGDVLSHEAKQAIAELKAGSVIKFEEVTAKSKSTGKELKLRGSQNFTIL